MNPISQHIVQKLWHYCNLLRDDGLSYPDYVEQLTFLIFLKMDEEQFEAGGPNTGVPRDMSWGRLAKLSGAELSRQYTHVLTMLGLQPGMLGIIFRGAKNRVQDPAKLERLIVELIGKENWTSFDADIKGDAYEGLLQKTSQDTKSGAGQYFTPRPVIRAITEVVAPQPDELICDPACGTCGFLLAAREYVLEHHKALSSREKRHQRLFAYTGIELVESVARLGAMNLFLHGIGSNSIDEESPIRVGDSLSELPEKQYDVVLTNPPFGKKSTVRIDSETRKGLGLAIVRSDFWTSTANKQLNFLQHVVSLLKSGGRAAVVVPDNVLFEGGAGELIRRRLWEECSVHTLLRLPTGIFYAQGVKANVLFFDKKSRRRKGAGEDLWVYDLRSNSHYTLRTRQIERDDLNEFVRCYESGNRKKRKELWCKRAPQARWKRFKYSELVKRPGFNLDFTWIPNEREIQQENLPTPQALVRSITDNLRKALSEFEAFSDDIM